MSWTLLLGLPIAAFLSSRALAQAIYQLNTDRRSGTDYEQFTMARPTLILGADTMGMAFGHHTMRVATFLFLLVGCYASSVNAQAPHTCPDNASWKPPGSPAGCTKEIRIYNNTEHPLYVLLQGSLEHQPASGNCPITPTGGGGDVWLQKALDTTDCFAIANDYHVYINPITGIATKEFASINVPWWSRTQGGPDQYVDWWRAARLFVFDDKAALDDSYTEDQKTPVQFATPAVTCRGNTVEGKKDSCQAVEIYRVAPDSPGQYNAQSPAQLTEFTFADIGDAEHNFSFNSLNQNYNVSAADQLYLPIAIERIAGDGKPADIGYVGTTVGAKDFRTAIEKFTGADKNPANPPNWPIYNNPRVNGHKKYPNAGIRAPSIPITCWRFTPTRAFLRRRWRRHPLSFPRLRRRSSEV
jgi:hypothetical protein